MFRAIDLAFDRIYGSETTTPLGRRLLNAIAVMTTVGIALLVGAQLVLGFPVVERFVPTRAVSRDLPGTVTAGIGLLVSETAFHLYSTVAGQYQAYGFLGIVLLFLLWLYVGALALLFGAVVNAVIE